MESFKNMFVNFGYAFKLTQTTLLLLFLIQYSFCRNWVHPDLSIEDKKLHPSKSNPISMNAHFLSQKGEEQTNQVDYPQNLSKIDGTSQHSQLTLKNSKEGARIPNNNEVKKLRTRREVGLNKRATDLVCIINAGAAHSCDHREFAEAMRRYKYITAVQGPGKRAFQISDNNEDNNVDLFGRGRLKLVAIRPFGYETDSLGSNSGLVLEFVTS